jgi:hypothetical protein
MIKISKVIQLLSVATIVSFSSCKKETVEPAVVNNTHPANSNQTPSQTSVQGDSTTLRKHPNNTSSTVKPNIVTSPQATTSVPPVMTPPPVVTPPATPVVSKSNLISVTGVPVYKENGGNNAFFYQTGMTIDADGAYKCYHANSSMALSNLEMAGYPGNWWALVTDSNGEPIVQGANDPAPGYYIAQTSLENQNLPRTDPHRYVDALTIPYVVLPPQLQNAGNARLGDFAAIYNKNNNKITYAIFADQGPETHIGEASVAAAHNVGLELVNKEGGANNGIIYIVFPGSGNGSVRTVSEINSQGAALLNSWGGLEKLKASF